MRMNFKTGLFIGTNFEYIRDFNKKIFQQDQLGTLYVKLLSSTVLEQINQKRSVFVRKEKFRKDVSNFYRCSQNSDLDLRVLLSNFKNPSMLEIMTSKPIEVVYCDSSFSSSSLNNLIQNYILNKSADCRTILLPAVNNDNSQCFTTENEVENFPVFENVVLGGTFDKLHVGHKLLLSEAVMKCTERLVVGVSAESLLRTKILSEFIEDLLTRIELVKIFLNDIEPSLVYDVVPIYDIYGPTKSDPTLQLIVISPDTLRGAEKVNECRENTGLNKLFIHEIDLIETSKESDGEEDKVSSSNIRMRMLGNLLKTPAPRPKLSPRPYIIGLTGGIASGKSSVSTLLQSFGCSYIDCDKLAHKMYDYGSAGYHFIKETFGFKVLNEDGSVNRKQLASIVFSNKEQLDRLNAGIWPLTLKAIKEEIASTNKEVVIVEAALLIQANWWNECHEIWSCIIPPNEAVKRLQDRNNLSIEEAESRINSQPTNKEYVAHSNVVFCTLWDQSFTRQQVENAWNSLKKRLPSVQ